MGAGLSAHATGLKVDALGCATRRLAPMRCADSKVSLPHVLAARSLPSHRLMSPTARLSATFVPLLSPPLRISVQSLRWLTRRPPLVRPSSPQCRSLHLYKTARATTIHGMHKILAFSQYSPPNIAQSDHTINLVKFVENEAGANVRETVAEGLTLQQLLDDYIGPGKILRLVDTVPRIDAPPDQQSMVKRKTAEKHRDYSIIDAFSTGAHAEVGGKKATKARGNATEIAHMLSLREIKIQLHTPMKHFGEMLDRAYQFIQLGSPVEFDICIRHITDKKAAVRFADSPQKDSLDYVYSHFPHLRPDFIFKSMPEGTRWVVDPFSNGRHVLFVLGRGTKRDEFGMSNFTKRVLNVQKAVLKGVGEGRIQQLPRGARSALASRVSGQRDSLDSAPTRINRGDEDGSSKSDVGKTARNVVQEATRERPMEEGVRKSALHYVQEATRERLVEEDGGADAGKEARRASNPTQDVPADRKALWKAWTAGGEGNDARYYVPRTKDARKPVDKGLKRFLKSSRRDK
ncbi:hypothetical protein P171DRAFT_432917 [Karstenula rhodostoma CBS 690.94]|uniref:Uncharacterized protein n=1 Tax=Karstenula rhodostoma CBS 690.94 TaxID=1392251 RepID=A0A9P4PGV2_9PLEO|nr:hypothetical protein P171DRAFT_432917 [Karstenula rhodostoma CBS 690.94]